ncbi:MAG TPA: RimJ/RimL family protein N-acetyltransferase [Micromonosporaceae bacterium]|nr:RimJ/RimL family protein N-acetyltransferase [Micromonosporaceae bacterium]HCU51833.1 RimJ/RimL family protein N-acetyltransferase [Micromonosporaceae bacterium]
MLSYPLTDDAEMRALEPWNAAEFAAYIERDRAHLSPWLPWAKALTDEEATREWLQRYANRVAVDDGRIYGIWLDGDLAGGTLFRVFDQRFGTAEIGVWLSPAAGGRGLITKAAERMIAYVFAERGLNRIEWRCVPTNERSIAAAKRLGLTRDGVLREAFPYEGKNHDVEIWSLLAREWRVQTQ